MRLVRLVDNERVIQEQLVAGLDSSLGSNFQNELVHLVVGFDCLAVRSAGVIDVPGVVATIAAIYRAAVRQCEEIGDSRL